MRSRVLEMDAIPEEEYQEDCFKSAVSLKSGFDRPLWPGVADIPNSVGETDRPDMLQDNHHDADQEILRPSILEHFGAVERARRAQQSCDWEDESDDMVKKLGPFASDESVINEIGHTCMLKLRVADC